MLLLLLIYVAIVFKSWLEKLIMSWVMCFLHLGLAERRALIMGTLYEEYYNKYH